jgi:hypothetical protein
MKGRVPDIVGRAVRERNAVAWVTPVATQLEDGSWQVVTDLRSLFPPSGTVKVHGIFANTLRDGDLVIFDAVAEKRPNAPSGFRAVSARRLARFLGNASCETVESSRRLLVEVGLETGSAGQWAVRIGEHEVVRMTLTQGEDGRWRASDAGLASVPVRRFSTERLVSIPEAPDWPDQYDFEGSELLDKAVNWSRDDDYLRAAAVACSPGNLAEATAAIELALKGRIDELSGRVSLVGGKDASVLAELVRARFLAERVSWERETLEHFHEAILEDAVVNKLIDEAVARKYEVDRVLIVNGVRDEVRAEMAAERAAFAQQTKSLIADLEASEMAALEGRRADATAEIETSINELRSARHHEFESWTSTRRDDVAAEIANLEHRRESIVFEINGLEQRKESIAQAIDEGRGREQELADRVDRLVNVEKKLSGQGRVLPGVASRLDLSVDDTLFGLSDLMVRLRKVFLLTQAGVDAIARIAIFATAGEVPIIKGEDGDDLLELAGAMLARGRLVRMIANPTVLTYEDLWSAAGGNGATPLAVAAEAAAVENAPMILAVIAGADESSARFWFPGLADGRRRGLLPLSLAACVSIHDPSSEEGERLSNEPGLIEASGLFVDSAAPGALGLMTKIQRQHASLRVDRIEVDLPRASLMLCEFGEGLGLIAAQRLARVHAAAVEVFGEVNSKAVVADFARRLGAKVDAAPSKNREGLTLVGDVANA